MSEKQKTAEDIVNRIVKNIDAKSAVLAKWGKSWQMYFTDINVGYVLKMGMDGKVEKIDKADKKGVAAVTMIFDTPDTLVKMMNKQLNNMAAMSTGKCKVEGPIPELMKISAAMS